MALCHNIENRLQTENSVLSPGFSPAQLQDAIHANDEVATGEYCKACGYLACGIVNMIHMYNPGIVIIGDQLAALAPDTMLQIIYDKINDTVRPLVSEELRIEINRLPYNPILIGAGAIAAQQVFINPMEHIL